MKLLHVDSGILGDLSVTRRLSASVVDHWRRTVPGLEVVERDLARDPLPHLSGAMLMAQADGHDVPEALRHDLAEGEAALAEFLAADVIVIGAPMYNFSIPSQLKAWIDRLAVRGRTFRYTADGPEALAGGRKVIVASARGGVFRPGTPSESMDHQERYLRAVFGFLGITDLEFIRAEGVSTGPEAKDQAIASAEAAIPSLLAAAA